MQTQIVSHKFRAGLQIGAVRGREEEEEKKAEEEEEEENEEEQEEEEVEWSGGHNKPVPAANLSCPLLLPEGTATHFLFLKILFLSHCRHIFYLRLATFCAERAGRPL